MFSRLIWKGLSEADFQLILGGTNVPFEGAFKASFKLILRKKKNWAKLKSDNL